MPPVSVPLDLELTDEQIYQLTEEMVTAAPGHMSRAEWYERMLQRMMEEGKLEEF